MPAHSLALFALALAASSSEPIRLPVTLVRASPVTTITVGNQAVRAIVDTGGGELMLSGEVIQAAGGVKLAQMQTSNDASGKQYVHARFRMPVIEIGGLVLQDAVVIEAPDQAGGSPVPNSIGRQFLSKYFVVVDYAAGAITLWPPDSESVAERARCGDAQVPMEDTVEEHLAVSRFETTAGPLRLVWDTGATYSMLPVAMAETLRGATIARGNTKFYPSERLAAAGRDFGPLEFVLLPLQPPKDFEGMLGANFFARHVVCFDYVRRKISLR